MGLSALFDNSLRGVKAVSRSAGGSGLWFDQNAFEVGGWSRGGRLRKYSRRTNLWENKGRPAGGKREKPPRYFGLEHFGQFQLGPMGLRGFALCANPGGLGSQMSWLCPGSGREGSWVWTGRVLGLDGKGPGGGSRRGHGGQSGSGLRLVDRWSQWQAGLGPEDLRGGVLRTTPSVRRGLEKSWQMS